MPAPVPPPLHLEFPPELPVSARAHELAALIRAHRVVVVAGATGSGKSTQLPKICLLAGRGQEQNGRRKLIGHTQPRRLAARTIAKRVADEMKSTLGKVVGFKVRFTDETGPDTRVKLMTDGVLLAELGADPWLRAYDTIIVDECHERSLNVDLLLGHLKRLLAKRSDLHVVVTSATLDTEKFAAFFADAEGRPAPVAVVEGRTYPVEVRWRAPVKLRDELTGETLEEDPEEALLGAVREAISHGPGDILLFQPTERDIRDCCELLQLKLSSHLKVRERIEVLPLYARLTAAEQERAFSSAPHRRIVVATNVAESSVTVPGVRFVVDTGTARVARFSGKGGGLQRLPVEAVSQASCEQRKGRCGRVGPGVCFRLFGEDDYAKREPFTAPEVQRADLAGVALQVEALGLGNLGAFPFMDPPRTGAVKDAYKTLWELGAVEHCIEREWTLTAAGRKLANLPVDPRVGAMLLAAEREGCLAEMLVLAAAVESQDPRDRPVDKQAAADQAHARFRIEGSDFLSLLRIWDFWHERRREGAAALRKACRTNFLSFMRLREWADLHHQLLEMCGDRKMRIGERATFRPGKEGEAPTHPKADAIHRAVLAGFLTGIGMKNDEGSYDLPGGNGARLWPGSACAKKRPLWVVAVERVETSDKFLRGAAAIKPDWIEQLGDHLCKRIWNEPRFVPETGTVMAFEKVLLGGLPVVQRRRVPFGPKDPAAARRLFILHALVYFECGKMEPLPFQRHNRAAVKAVQEREAKTGRRGLLRGDEERFAFFDARLPEWVVGLPELERWLKGGDDPMVTPKRTPSALREGGDPRAHGGPPSTHRGNPRDSGGRPLLGTPVTEGPLPHGRGSFSRDAELCFSESDVLVPDAGAFDPRQYPDTLDFAGRKLRVTYPQGAAGARGVELRVPREALPQLDARRLGWLVPGLLEKRVEALIRTLPKDLRRPFVPATQTAAAVTPRLSFGAGDLLEQLATELTRISGEPVRAADFAPAQVEEDLAFRLAVVDESGAPLLAGRDPAELRRELGVRAAAALAAAPAEDAGPQTRWTFGDLPASRTLKPGAASAMAYPALVDQGAAGAVLRDFADPLAAAAAHRAGVRRLLAVGPGAKLLREAKERLKRHRPLEAVRPVLATLPKDTGGADALALLILDRAAFGDDPVPRTEVEFEAAALHAETRLASAADAAAALAASLLTEYQRHQQKLAEAQRRAIPKEDPLRQDLASQLAHLLLATADLPPDAGSFWLCLPWEHLRSYPRYLAAMNLRLDKALSGHLPRDRERMQAIAPLWIQYLHRTKAHLEAGRLDPAREAYRWLLEEYRVALFAQELGTAEKVSPQRLAEAWKTVG